jgi:branched-chain amino acid transport system ATP-binding protein
VGRGIADVLETRDLTMRFGGLVAVDNLSFTVNQGEILGIIGPNGAGKTTVLGCISGVLRPTSGTVHFEGKDITAFKPHTISGLGIARNFQASLLFMMLPVVENVFTACHLHLETPAWKRVLHLPAARKEEAALRKKAEEILDRSGLGGVKYEMTRNLPHGHQRILSVCIALATNPKLLLLDEPLTGMNESEIQAMIELVRWIRSSGITLVIIEHNVQALMVLCDRMVVLDHGQKIAEGPPGEIRENIAVIDAYLGKEQD